MIHSQQKLLHGGCLTDAEEQFGINKSELLDLSTGINPDAWPVPDIPAYCWQRLPEPQDALNLAAQHYYQCDFILPIAGSQAAIQLLPYLRPESKVGLLVPMYAEHSKCWQQAGHCITPLRHDAITVNDIDVLVIANPNNPTAVEFGSQQLLQWHQALAKKGGWLIVDEAFIDAEPQNSLCRHIGLPGLIVLRSLGKFFGLAGARVGFIAADKEFLDIVENRLGPWSINHASRCLAEKALTDVQWQRYIKPKLQDNASRLNNLLVEYFVNQYNLANKVQGTSLFQTVFMKDDITEKIYQIFGKQGIILRYFKTERLLRFGLPNTEKDWQRLTTVLKHLMEQFEYA